MRQILIILSILYSTISLGQFTNSYLIDSNFVKFSNKLNTLERIDLGLLLEPLDTIEIENNTSKKLEKFKLKHTISVGNPPSYLDLKNRSNGLSSYWSAKYGTDYFVLGFFKNTGNMNDVKYYYEIIREEE